MFSDNEIPLDERQMRVDELNLQALKMTMKTRTGRRFVYSVIAQCGLMRNAFAGDPYITAFNNGQQNVGQWLFDQIDTHCPEQYLTMMKEAKEDYQNDRRNDNERSNILDNDTIAVIAGGNRGGGSGE